MGDEAEVLVSEARAADLEQVLLAIAVDVVPDVDSVNLYLRHGSLLRVRFPNS
jgi:hypothetical protein